MDVDPIGSDVDALDQGGQEGALSCCGQLGPALVDFRGALYLMLRNRIYRGEIVHKEQSYVSEHTPIIDQPLWDAVRASLAPIRLSAATAPALASQACSPACCSTATAIG